MAGEGDERLVVGAEVHPVGQHHLELHPAPGVVHQRVQRLREELLVVLAPGGRGVVGALRPQRPAAEQHPDVDPHQHDGQARGAEQPGPAVDDDHERPGHDHRHHQPADDDPDQRPQHVQHPTDHQRRWGDAAGAHGRQRRARRGARLGASAGPGPRRAGRGVDECSAAPVGHGVRSGGPAPPRPRRQHPRRPARAVGTPPPRPGGPGLPRRHHHLRPVRRPGRAGGRGAAAARRRPRRQRGARHAELPAERHRLLRGAAPGRHGGRAQPALHRGRAAPAVHRPRGPGGRGVGHGRAGRGAAARRLVARARRRRRPHRRAAPGQAPRPAAAAREGAGGPRPAEHPGARGAGVAGLVTSPPLDPAHPRPTADDVALLLYTSGTTGEPKGVPLRHRNLVANVVQGRAWVPGLVEGEETFLLALPLFHAYGVTVGMLLGIDLAATLVLLPKPEIGLLMEAIERRLPSFVPAVPPLYDRIATEAQRRGVSVTGIRYALSGAMPLPAELVARWEAATGGLLVEGYGLTETSPVVVGNPMTTDRRPGSIGVPFPDVEVRIAAADDLDRAVPLGERGELLVRGPQVFAGYRGRPRRHGGRLPRRLVPHRRRRDDGRRRLHHDRRPDQGGHHHRWLQRLPLRGRGRTAGARRHPRRGCRRRAAPERQRGGRRGRGGRRRRRARPRASCTPTPARR